MTSQLRTEVLTMQFFKQYSLLTILVVFLLQTAWAQDSKQRRSDSASNSRQSQASASNSNSSSRDNSGGVIESGSSNGFSFVNSSATTLMKINDNGTVGIGVAIPNERLEISGNFRLPETTANGGVIFFGINRFIHNFGNNNIFAGKNAGNLTMAGTGNNTGVGLNALNSLITGNTNLAVGANALGANSYGSGNTAAGFNALLANTNGSENTGLGAYTLLDNFGDENTAVGDSALLSNITGSGNTALGDNADVAASDLTNATAIGANAIVDASNKIRLGDANVTQVETDATITATAFIGDGSGLTGLSGGDYSQGGEAAPYNRTLGNTNAFDLGFITDGVSRLWIEANGNIGLGTFTPSEQLEITGNFRLPATTANTGIIYSDARPFLHSFGTNNFFAGGNAGNLTMSGVGNTGAGEEALKLNAGGDSNTGFGSFALKQNTSGNENTAVGQSALTSNDTGIGNTAVGSTALVGNQSGANNTAVGRATLFSTQLGSQNTAVGALALDGNIDGTQNTTLGYNADVSAGDLTNATAIGANAVVGSSNSMVLGTPGTNIGIGASSPLAIMHIEDNQAGAATTMRHANTASADSSNIVRLVHRLNTDALERTAFRIETSFIDIADATSTSLVNFHTRQPSGLSAAMTFDGIDLGIGTTEPETDVHISRKIGDAILRIEADSDDNNINDEPVLEFYRSGFIKGKIGLTDGEEPFKVISSSDLYLMASGDTDLTINQTTGNVGIGKINASSKLHIVEPLGDPFRVDDQDGDATPFVIKGTGRVGIGVSLPGYPLEMASGAHVTVGGTWTNASSRDYKENIRDLGSDEAMAALHDLQPKKYNYRTEPDEEYVGFIAEDVPNLVATNNRKSLSPMDIVAVLTKVVQQQQKQIAELEAKIENLK